MCACMYESIGETNCINICESPYVTPYLRMCIIRMYLYAASARRPSVDVFEEIDKRGIGAMMMAVLVLQARAALSTMQMEQSVRGD